MRDKNYKALQGKLERLEKLCRALQRERNDLNLKLQAKDPEEEGTGLDPPDPQPQGLNREVEGLVSQTEKLGLQPEEEGTSFTQLTDD